MEDGVDGKLRPMERIWLYTVFTHTEDLEVQKYHVEEAEKKLEGMEDGSRRIWMTIYTKHLAVIEKFGRFPHRNQFMHRKDAAGEEEFVKDETFRFDLPVRLLTDPVTGEKKIVFVKPGEEPQEATV